jgi:Cof subfamily protein (haloacid dehalogenase superfamily)
VRLKLPSGFEKKATADCPDDTCWQRTRIASMRLPALIACDVDGTLLDDDETITPRTRSAVHAAIAGGAQFILATGRPPRWVRPVVDALGFAPMAVCANGAVVYDPAADRVVSVRTLAVDTLGELAEVATRAIPGAGLAVERVGGSAHDTATPQFVSSPGYEHAWLNPDNTEVSIQDLLSAPAVKLLIRKAGARSADMAAELAKHIGIEGDITYSTDNGLVEIVPLGVSKATGVEEIARPLGITDDDVVAFGDMPNDIPMLLRAGHSVAMGNAHPDVMAAADEVTAPNTDDGVARVLERWWL